MKQRKKKYKGSTSQVEKNKEREEETHRDKEEKRKKLLNYYLHHEFPWFQQCSPLQTFAFAVFVWKERVGKRGKGMELKL